MKLTDKLREMSLYNSEVPEWAYKVIDTEITYCEDCKWYKNFFCKYWERIASKEGFCDKGRR